MTTNSLNTYAGISAFSHSLSRVLKKERNIDLKGTKIIHDVAKALGYANAHHLKSVMDEIERNTIDGTVIKNKNELDLASKMIGALVSETIDIVTRNNGFKLNATSKQNGLWSSLDITCDTFYECIVEALEASKDASSFITIIKSLDDDTIKILEKSCGDLDDKTDEQTKVNALILELLLMFFQAAHRSASIMLMEIAYSIDSNRSLSSLDELDEPSFLGGIYKEQIAQIIKHVNLTRE